jgi:hypothetical protein
MPRCASTASSTAARLVAEDFRQFVLCCVPGHLELDHLGVVAIDKLEIVLVDSGGFEPALPGSAGPSA